MGIEIHISTFLVTVKYPSSLTVTVTLTHISRALLFFNLFIYVFISPASVSAGKKPQAITPAKIELERILQLRGLWDFFYAQNDVVKLWSIFGDDKRRK
ncbi:hypothetical protein CMV_028775 [Castanea mollissima]|uniref:Uncharacterized protein n=1 Tax=Castanea mollissima TaxID=60419 RepID=A0A8J4V824_9ROSI|nr:hypothetical protein CMV_028775 [Castanea mollissima]